MEHVFDELDKCQENCKGIKNKRQKRKKYGGRIAKQRAKEAEEKAKLKITY